MFSQRKNPIAIGVAIEFALSLDREIKVLAHPWQSHFSVQMFTKTIIQAKKRVFKSIKRNTYKANSPKRRDESEVSFFVHR